MAATSKPVKTPKKKIKLSDTGGRPLTYKKRYESEIFDLKAAGYTDAAIARHWGVHSKRLISWKKQHEAFYDQYKKGVEASHVNLTQLAKNSLFKLVKGYDFSEVEKKMTVDKNGEMKLTNIKELKKHLPPNIAAIMATLYSLDSVNFKRNPELSDNQNLNIVGALYHKIGENNE